MYVRNLQQEKGIGKIFAAVWTELHRKGLEGGTAIPCPAEETGLPTTHAKSFSYASRLLVRNSSPHSTCHPATYRYLAVPRVLVSS